MPIRHRILAQRPRLAKSLAVLALGMGMADGAHGGIWFFYKFTPIADSQGGFPFENFIGAPAINADGLIVYHGHLTGGIEGIFTSKIQGSINTVADSGSAAYDLGFAPDLSINDSGQVSFIALSEGKDQTTVTAYRGQGNSATALVDYPYSLNNYCGTQINANGSVASLATRDDGGQAVIVQGGGPILSVIRAVAVDKPNTDMDQAIVVSQLNCAPSINNDGMVAFTGIKTDAFGGVFTGDSEGNFTEIVGTDSRFNTFGNVTLNESGSLNKVGMVLFETGLKSGHDALYLWQAVSPTASSLTEIADATAMGAEIGGFAMDYRGQVAYELLLDAFDSAAVYRGPGSLFGRVVGPGDVLFGRTVYAAHIDRGALNFNDQLAVHLIFTDGSEMIARGDPTSRFPITGFPVSGILQATTGRGSTVSVGTTVSMPPAFSILSFDLKFLSIGGALEVKLGDATIKSIAAEELGVRRHISIPIDLRKASKTQSAAAGRVGTAGSLQFVLSGRPGLTAQIGNVRIPGIFADSFQSQSLARWHVIGGSAAVVNDARLPVNIHIEAEKHVAGKSGGHIVSVVISGGEGIDVTKDIVRATLRLAGSPPGTKRDTRGQEVPACDAREKEKQKELVCQFEVKGLSSKNLAPTLTLEAATPFGWGVSGSARVHL
jgi:hypothetical protein